MKPLFYLKTYSTLILLIASWSCFAESLPRERTVPGGIIIVPITTANKPTIYYNEQRVAVIPQAAPKTGWLAVVGIPLSAEPPGQTLQVASPLREQVLFTIQDKAYASERITLSDKQTLEPSEENQQRIAAERKILTKALSHWSETNPFEAAFIPPLHGRISSYFGFQRIFNDEVQSQHKGLDIAAPTATPISAPASGIVLVANNFFFLGNTVILDHGQGLITLYAHMDELAVKPSDYVAQGKQIGTVGQTGRATGPHLHWGVILNNAAVDPLLFISANAITATDTN